MSFAELAGLSQTQEGRLTSDQIKMSKKLKIIDMPRSAYRICLNRPKERLKFILHCMIMKSYNSNHMEL